MNNRDIIIICVLVLLVYLIYEDQQKSKKIRSLEDSNDKLIDITKKQNINLKEVSNKLKETINNKSDLPISIKEGLRKLSEDFKSQNKAVSVEINKAIELVKIEQEPNAIFSLTKIIENLLKQLYKGSRNFESLIKKAGEDSILNKSECAHLNGLRATRNVEAHEIGTKMDKSLSRGSLMICMGIITKVGKICF